MAQNNRKEFEIDMNEKKTNKNQPEAMPFWNNGRIPEDKIKQLCRNYPECPWGDECMYLHHRFRGMCHFKTRCTKSSCPYQHPQDKSDK